MALFTRARTNPIFYPDRLELLLHDEPDRLQRMRTEPGSIDLLTWNVFASLDTHDDPDWLAYRLQEIGGPNLRAPIRISMFSGRHRAPHLRPSTSYLRAIHERTGVRHSDADGIAVFEQPIEVPVRIETPDVLLLVDTGARRLRAGAGGRDRIAELIDAGLVHARRLSTRLSIGFVLEDGSAVLSTQVPRLATTDGVAAVVPWRDRSTLPRVDVHGTPWSTMLSIWEEEAHRLDLAGQPVKGFRSYADQTRP